MKKKTKILRRPFPTREILIFNTLLSFKLMFFNYVRIRYQKYFDNGNRVTYEYVL